MLRAAVIGLGRMGSTYDDEVTTGGSVFLPYAHAPSYVAASGVTLVAGADPNVAANNFFVCGQLYPNGFNGTRYCNDRVTELVQEGKRTVAQADREPIYQELSEIINRELPAMPLWVAPIVTAASDKVTLTYDQYNWDDVQLWTISE